MKDSAQQFKALSDETRLRILALLLTNRELCVCHIMAALQLPQSTASRHLAYLRNSGWVDDRKEGLWVYYSIPTDDAPLRRGMLDVLRSHLLTLPVAVADAQRLAQSLQLRTCS